MVDLDLYQVFALFLEPSRTRIVALIGSLVVYVLLRHKPAESREKWTVGVFYLLGFAVLASEAQDKVGFFMAIVMFIVQIVPPSALLILLLLILRGLQAHGVAEPDEEDDGIARL